MNIKSKGFHCNGCNKVKRFDKNRPNHILHLLLSFVTASIWFWFVYLPLILFAGTWRCTECGRKR